MWKLFVIVPYVCQIRKAGSLAFLESPWSLWTSLRAGLHLANLPVERHCLKLRLSMNFCSVLPYGSCQRAICRWTLQWLFITCIWTCWFWGLFSFSLTTSVPENVGFGVTSISGLAVIAWLVWFVWLFWFVWFFGVLWSVPKPDPWPNWFHYLINSIS